jgi:hypothetical protein
MSFPNMKTLRAFIVRLAGLLRRQTHETEMAEELHAHLDGLIERNLAAGMSPEDARFAALRTFGGVAQITERARDERRSAWGEHLLQDLRYAIRQLRKNPGFTAVVVLSLAFGIGTNAAIFSLVDARVLKMLPVKNPEELVLFQWLRGPQGSGPSYDAGDAGADNIDRETGQRTRRVFSSHIFERFRADHKALAAVFAASPAWDMNVWVDGTAEAVAGGQLVSGNYYDSLGVAAWRGRLFRAEDDQAGAEPVALGALPRWITSMIWRESLALVGLGAIVGIVAASFAARLIAKLLYGLSPVDPVAYGLAALLLVAVASLACFLPARRAAKVDPVVALRAE